MLKKECEDCNRLIRIRNLIRYKGKLICKLCKNKKSRIPLCNLFTIPKSYIPKKKKEKIISKKEAILPKIKGSKIRKQKSIVYGMSLTMNEKQFLFGKAIRNGLSYEDVIKKVKMNTQFLSELVKKLRNKNKSEFEINRKFNEEFAKLISKREKKKY